MIERCENAWFTGRSYTGWDNYIEADLTKKEEAKKLLSYQPDVIIHAAGSSNALADNPLSNIIGTFNLLSECPTKPRLIYLSSATVYGPESFEKGASEQDMPNPQSLYGSTKLGCENILTYFKNAGKIETLTILRPCAVVGEGATHGLLPAIEKKCYDNEDEIELIGKYPGSVKPYLHVDDLCDAIIYYLRNPQNATVNIAGHGELSVHIIAELYCCLKDLRPIVKWTGEFWPGDNTLIRMECGKMPVNVRSSFKAVYDTFTR